MLSHEHLALREVRLQPGEKWATELNKLLFVFPTGGRGHYCSRTVTHRLSPGDVLILNPTSTSEVRTDDESELAFCFFAVSPEHVFPLFSCGEITQFQNICEGFKATKLHGSTTPLARQCHRLLAELPPQVNLDHRGQLLRVIADILDVEFSKAQPQRPGFVRAEDHLMQVLETLSPEELMSSSVGQLANRFGCSKRHLSRLFQLHFGLSVAALKMESRLLKAVALLRDPDVKVISVAEQCGFNYLGLFNNCFKKRFGVTPSQLRKIMAETDGPNFRLADHLPHCALGSKGLWLHSDRSNNRQPANARSAQTQSLRPVKLVITVMPPGSSPPRETGANQQERSSAPQVVATSYLNGDPRSQPRLGIGR